jgi:hypothetical protein
MIGDPLLQNLDGIRHYASPLSGGSACIPRNSRERFYRVSQPPAAR